jgi:hypothetical protein
MQGHDQVIAMRLQGFRPEHVFIFDTPGKVKPSEWKTDYQLIDVHTNGDPVESLDLRFLVGMAVTVLGSEQKRCKALAGACVKAGAALVAVTAGDKTAVWSTETKKWNT